MVGARGEAAACRVLTARGYRILARNVRSRAGELDLVCHDGDAFVFCEVKARRPSHFGAPQEALSATKQARLARLASAYLARIGRAGAPWRVELVAVELDAHAEPSGVEVVPVWY